MTSFRRRIPAMCAAVAVLLAASVACATSALYVTDADQARLSTAVVVATVGAAKVAKDPQWRIVTRTSIAVSEVLYGEAPSQVEIRQIGGSLDGVTVYVPGDARLEPGERCVLFLRKVDGRWFLTAMEQSMYLLQHDGRLGETMHRTLHGGLYRRGPDGRLAEHVEPAERPVRPLSAFRTEMAALAHGEAR